VLPSGCASMMNVRPMSLSEFTIGGGVEVMRCLGSGRSLSVVAIFYDVVNLPTK
jgi:hypothetical protein